MTVTTFQQTAHPELSATVTQITQDVVYANFGEWYIECLQHIEARHSVNYRVFQNYYNQGLTPVQAVKKYFL